MQRYHFHFRWRDDAVFDEQGIEFENFPAAYLRACELVHQVRRRFPEAGSDWWIEISTGLDTPTTIFLPWCRAPIQLNSGFSIGQRGAERTGAHICV